MNTFDERYLGRPPWEIGRPQPAFVELFRRGEIRGSVLDVGCGTGETALFLASQGLEVWGIDTAPRAIVKARSKAAERGIDVTFREYSALDLIPLGRSFDTVIDSGLFHAFSDAERPVYAASVQSALNSGGVLLLLCFSEKEPPGWGPRRVTRDEIRAEFHRGWEVRPIRESFFETSLMEKPAVPAWLAAIQKIAPSQPAVW